MIKIKTADAIGPALDWLVARALQPGAESFDMYYEHAIATLNNTAFRPSTDWSQGGPIIERGRITVYPDYIDATTESGKEITIENGWKAHSTPRRYWMTPRGNASGPTPLIAAMRCYVTSKLGDEVEVSEELL